MDDDELVLNGLRKRGHGLILEEHSHCEVPEGCGGVVLRWVRPDAPVDLDIRVFAGSATVTVWVDGVTPPRTRVRLAHGAHVLGFAVETASETPSLLAHVELLQRSVADNSIVTTSGEPWFTTATPPLDGWMLPAANLTNWLPAVVRPEPATTKREEWQLGILKKSGATAVGHAEKKRRLLGILPGDVVTKVWFRRVFAVTLEGIR